MKTNKLTLLSLAAVSLLQACGGSDYQPQAGEAFYLAMEVDGKEVSKETYKIYSVSDNSGHLSAVPVSNDKALPHIAIFQSTTGVRASTGLSFEEIQNCYMDFWQQEQLLYPTSNMEAIAKKMGALGEDLDFLCARSKKSGLSSYEFINLLETVHKYWPNEDDAVIKAMGFFDDISVSPGEFLATLTSLGSNWRDFASRVSAKRGGIGEFYTGYNNSPLTLKPYLKAYIAQNPLGPVAAASLLKKIMVATVNLFSNTAYAQTATTVPAVPAVVITPEQVIKLADQVMKVTDWAWDIVKDNKPTSTITGDTFSRVLSANDTAADWTKYQNAKFNSSKQVTFIGYSFLVVPVFIAKLRLTTYYNASHADPAIGGHWIPSMSFTPDEIWADWGWNINANATVVSPVNTGTALSPIPEVQVDVRMNASSMLSNFTRNFTFTANGATGAGPI